MVKVTKTPSHYNQYFKSLRYIIALLIVSLLYTHPALAGARLVVKIWYECLPAAVCYTGLYNDSLMYL